MKTKNKGAALIIAIICTVIMCMIMIYFLEKLIPVGRNIKGIENSTIAYYDALTGVENAMFFIKTNPVGTETGITFNPSSQKGFGYKVTASGITIPMTGEGNSDFDKDYNIISSGKPVQIAIFNGIDWNNVEIQIKPPVGISLRSSDNSVGIVNWQLSGKNASGVGLTIYASGESNMILGNQINDNVINLNSKLGFDLNGNTGLSINTFYNNGSYLNGCTTNLCSLKLSIVKPLISTTGQSIPFLEYKINFAAGSTPLQYAKIESSGYSYGFKRNINRDVKQFTTSELSDYTIIN